MTHRKHVLIEEHVWVPADEPSGERNVTKDTCKDCGQTLANLRLSAKDSGDEQVDPEKVRQTWSALLSGIQKEFTQLSGFKSPKRALNTLRGRYRGEKAEWKDMPIQYLTLWESPLAETKRTRPFLLGRRGQSATGVIP